MKKDKINLSENKFTDIIFCIVFLAFVLFNGFTIIYSLSNKNIKKFEKIYKSNESKCEKEKSKGYNILYLPKLEKSTTQKLYCIKNCPIKEGNLKYFDFKEEKFGEINASKGSLFFDKFCVQKIKKKNLFLKALALISENETLMNNLQERYHILILSFLFAFCFAFVSCYIFKLFAKILIISLVALAIATFSFFGVIGILYYKGKTSPDFGSFTTYMVKHSTISLIFSIFCFIIDLFLVLLLIFGFNKLVRCSEIFEMVSEFIFEMKRIILVPLISIILNLACFTFFIYCFINLISSESIEIDKDLKIKLGNMTTFKKVMNGLFIFFIIWFFVFIEKCSNFILMYCSIVWFSKDENVKFPIINSLLKSTIYNFGSIAIGSFILALIYLLKIIFKTLVYILKRGTANNPIIVIFDKIGSYYLWILQKFLDILSHLAFVEIILKKKNFFLSSFRSTKIMFSNIGGFGLLDFFSFIFKFFFAVLIIGTTVLLNYGVSKISKIKYNTNMYILISLLSLLMTYVIVNIYSVCSQSLLYVMLRIKDMSEFSNSSTNQKLNKILNNDDKVNPKDDNKKAKEELI